MKLNNFYFNVVIQNPILPSVLYTSDITAKLNKKKRGQIMILTNWYTKV